MGFISYFFKKNHHREVSQGAREKEVCPVCNMSLEDVEECYFCEWKRILPSQSRR